METLPSNMKFALGVMKNYSTNSFRLETVSADTASAGRVVTVNLPQNALLDMKSFRWFFRAKCTGNTDSGVAPAETVHAKLPADIQSLISRVEVYINGIQVQQGSAEYNSIYKLLKLNRGNQGKDQSTDRAIQNGQIDTGATASDEKDVAVLDWAGVLNETSTRFIPTDLLGQIQVRITLAGNEVLVPLQNGSTIGAVFTTANAASNATKIKYEISDMYFTINSITVDGMYNAMLREKIQRDSYIPINYLEYYSFSLDSINATAATTRFSLSSQSINKIYASLRDGNYSAAGIPGYQLPADHVGDAYVANYFRFRNFNKTIGANVPNVRSQHSLNNVKYPQYLQTPLGNLCNISYSADKVGMSSLGTLISSYDGFQDGQFCATLRLNHPAGGCQTRGEDLSIMSGYDSRSVNTMATYEVQGMVLPAAQPLTTAVNPSAGTASCFVVVETLATLRCGLGGQLATIF